MLLHCINKHGLRPLYRNNRYSNKQNLRPKWYVISTHCLVYWINIIGIPRLSKFVGMYVWVCCCYLYMFSFDLMRNSQCIKHDGISKKQIHFCHTVQMSHARHLPRTYNWQTKISCHLYDRPKFLAWRPYLFITHWSISLFTDSERP